MKTLFVHAFQSLMALNLILFSMFAVIAQTPELKTSNSNPITAPGLFSVRTFINGRSGFSSPTPAQPNNTFYGTNALSSINQGDYNSAFGVAAGYSLTNGANNSFFGVNAGKSTAVGSDNSFFGVNAGFYNQSGVHNSFFGKDAGFKNITGELNSFIGSLAGFSNTDGKQNSYFGANAGYSNSSGNLNSFIGTESGKGNTTGSANTFLGYKSGLNTTDGAENTFVGSGAGMGNVSGKFNTMLGTDTNAYLPDLSYATAIGAGARAVFSNTIVLGRHTGADAVIIPGNVTIALNTALLRDAQISGNLSIDKKLKINELSGHGSTELCRNNDNEVAECRRSLMLRRNITNVAAFSPGLNLVQRLRPIRFEWKEGGMKDLGFGAEDVAAVEPLLVTYNDKGEVEGVKYDRIAAVLVNAVKEQQAQIEAQQQQLKKQAALIDGLKKLLCGKNPEAEVCK